MTAAQEAVLDRDEVAFTALFPAAATANAAQAWARIAEIGRTAGQAKLGMLVTYPELERATVDKHVQDVVLTAWFDFSSIYSTQDQVFQTTWYFQRGEENPQWFLGDLKIEHSSVHYDPLIGDLFILPEAHFDALAMDWEEAINPEPLLTRAFQAMLAEDFEALKSCSVAGSIFYAWDRRIDLPTVATDPSGYGQDNRRQTMRFFRQEMMGLRNVARELKVDPADLLPFFNAYSISAMPERCTKLELVVNFEGAGLPEAVASLAVGWGATHLKDRWLVETLWVEDASIWEYQLVYTP